MTNIMNAHPNTNSIKSVVFIVASWLLVPSLLIAGIANLADYSFPKSLAILNNDGFWLLLIPVIGLFAIFRDGRWSGWKVVEWSTLLSTLFWCGWIVSLAVGVVELSIGG